MNSVGSAPDAIYAEQVDTIFRQMPIALAVNLVNAGLTAAALAPFASQPLPLPWFLSVLLVTLGRLALWLHYRRVPAGPGRIPCFARLATAGSLLAGLAWGIGGALLLPVVPVPGQIFLTMVIGGMCAGTVVVSASHFPTLFAFLGAATLPMAVRFIGEGTALGSALGAMIVVFAAALSLAGRHLSRIVAETMRLRVELTETNRRLHSEMAGHQAAEAALRQAQKLEAVGQLTGGIAHDFNNLLTIIIGNLALAGARSGGCPAVVPLLDAAMQAAERGATLTQRLLAFARKQSLDPRPVDVVALVHGIEDMLRRTLGPQISLRISAEGGVPPAHIDSNQLELAILNLAINARDAMPGGGTVRIVIAERASGHDGAAELAPGSYVVLSVIDDGTGMDEATLDRAFDPFFTTKDAGVGSGLGLPMVQGFTVQSGGAVRIRSRPGEGTAVELWLPRADEPPVGKPVSRSGAEPGRAAASVLLCDDDDSVRGVLSDGLRSLGYGVYEASSADAALRILKTGSEVDLLIIDYAMPGMNGLEAIRQMRLQRPDLRPLLITGHAAVPGSAEIPVLRKPFTLDELARRTAEILAARDPV
jgi:signal transduction histidine kinase/CheY-like chemotaxis protein